VAKKLNTDLRIPVFPNLVVIPKSDTPLDRSQEKRRLRKHAILGVVREHGPISRSDIAKILRFNVPHTSELVEELVREGLAVEEPPRVIPRGRWPIPVRLVQDAASVIGIDIGKSATIAVAVDLGGHLLARVEEPTPQLSSAEEYCAWLEHVICTLVQTCGERLHPVAGVGLALPGLVISASSTGNSTSALSTTLARWIEDVVGVPAIVENDARMMAYGWYWFGAGRESTSFAVINVGYGLGLGLYLDGRIYTGKQGFAGELGYVPAGEPNVEGFLVCPDALENTASGAGILRLAKRAGLNAQDAREVAEMARRGDSVARHVFDEFSKALGKAIATVVNLFDLETIVLSGRVCRAQDLFFEKALAAARRHALEPILSNTEIVISHLDVDLGPLGAAGAVFHRIFETSHITMDHVL